MFSSGMEPDIKKYLLRILNSMSVIVLWMMINATLGIYLGWAMIDDKLRLINIIFYAWLLGSFIFLVYYLFRKWKL
ncbi:MAG: hypothetical protein H0V30_15565 [Chitinophagaceae bacterium]|jgi:uncharacterized membrane protein YcaP (DUF421 family)|nr:hypothetical protein [Chitinophagaceae bacterium]